MRSNLNGEGFIAVTADPSQKAYSVYYPVLCIDTDSGGPLNVFTGRPYIK